MPLATFHIFNPDTFRDYILNSRFTRKIMFIQNHHTWLPNYASMQTHPGEMYWLESMRHSHIHERGWADIGQNITIFPSGNVGLCRPIDVKPAGIYGANAGAVCIENLGNFDSGRDVMTMAQQQAITYINAVLCVKFGLEPVPSQVVYHHWYNAAGDRFPEVRINNGGVTTNDQKTCPGTAFFGGNTIADARANFYLPITAKMAALQNVPQAGVTKKVIAGQLNVRSGPGKSFGIIRALPKDTAVQVYTSQGGWSKISNTAEEWVYNTLLQ